MIAALACRERRAGSKKNQNTRVPAPSRLKRIKAMKKKSIIGVFAALLGLGMTTTSCEDMLTPDLDNRALSFTGTDTVNFYLGVLSTMQDVYENNILLGDIRSDLVDTTSYVSDSVAQISNFTKTEDTENGLLNRAAYYKVINQCNFYLAKVDTMAMKNSNYYMRREFAQVQMLRAWTYMQLVQNYGSVPFIVSPVDNANTGWETNPEKGWATADNLLDLLNADGLSRAYEYERTLGSIQYGSFENGAITVPHSLLVFPGDLVMGDLYLLRGASKADYEKAAEYYYHYMELQARVNGKGTGYSSAAMNRSMSNGQTTYFPSASGWASTFMDMSSTMSTTGDVSTLVLSAANSTFGTVMTRAAQIYGFDPTSSSSTTVGENSAGEEEITTSGTISVTADYKNRQIGASRKYTNLSNAQLYRYNTVSSTSGEVIDVVYPDGVGDARVGGTVVNVQTDAGVLPFVQKRAFSGSTVFGYGTSPTSFKYNYTFPVYRMRQVYLRYAEAINRAGFPRYAFAILRDGLTAQTIPTVSYDSIVDGKVVPYLNEVANGCNYIGVDELRRASSIPYMDFSNTIWNSNSGVHEYGCGESSDRDTLYTYDLIVGQRIADEEARATSGNAATLQSVKRHVAQLKAEETGDGDGTTEEGGGADGGDVEEPEIPEPQIPEDIGAQINAVETLIADELALETAFEGTRYYDLYRFARHKNSNTWSFGDVQTGAGEYGTNWFAWMISRRSENLKPYENIQQKNASLYSRLLNMDNWYLQNPQY